MIMRLNLQRGDLVNINGVVVRLLADVPAEAARDPWAKSAEPPQSGPGAPQDLDDEGNDATVTTVKVRERREEFRASP